MASGEARPLGGEPASRHAGVAETPDLCQALIPSWSTRGSLVFLPCGLIATELYDYGCEHEHVRRRWNCPAHSPADGQPAGCKQCFDLGHECPFTAVLVRRA